MADFPASRHPCLVSSKPCGLFALADTCKDGHSKGSSGAYST